MKSVVEFGNYDTGESEIVITEKGFFRTRKTTYYSVGGTIWLEKTAEGFKRCGTNMEYRLSDLWAGHQMEEMLQKREQNKEE